MPAVSVQVDLLLAQGKFGEAQGVARRLTDARTARDPLVVAAGHALLGKVYLAQHTPLQAIPELNLALQKLPDAGDLRALLVQAYLTSGQNEAALSFIQAEVERTPGLAAPRVVLAQVKQALGDTSGAASTLRDAIGFQPDWVPAYIALGELLQHAGDIAGAAQIYRAGLERSATHPDLLHRLALLEEQQQRFESARQLYERALTANPSDLFAANNLAALIADLWPTDETLLRRAAVLSQDFRLSSDPYLLDTAGWVAYRLGRLDDAVVLVQSASGKQPDNQQMRYHLAMIYQARGDPQRAREELERAVRSGADFRGIEDARQALTGN